MITKVLGYLMTFAFVAAGMSKLYERHPMYAEMHAKSDAWLAALGLQPFMNGEQLCIVIGVTEVVAGLLVPFFRAANAVLIAVMLAAIYTHFRMDGGRITKEAAPAAFLLALLMLLAVLRRSEKVAQQRLAEDKDE
ncbi:hypothetical protein BWQ96_08753 [Gracilariopsis chorda]|uniref:DoxX family protein n=1 Tax=Gracilariopsis chorda TaxID=448386 RepID=A0A2V3IK96_9FLOR|nr:hypothetical protein BWQ96_08753 [Gracilariopsis chorda]|eukprot:PXF41550.1 hypothetical protein BWQ96_08753 [Gracilariopsis chorda]